MNRHRIYRELDGALLTRGCGTRLLLTVAFIFFSCSAPLAYGQWVAQGPSPILNGQVENIPGSNPVIGAVHSVLPHPTNPDILYVGAANGGVWKTTNATAAGGPNWSPLTDFESSLSIGALEFDPLDATSNTLVAGIGRFSALSQRGGDRTGLLYSTDAGTSWSSLDGGGMLSGGNISGVAARGNTIVTSVNVADSFTFGNIGIFRSTDGGATFSQISSGNGAATGLPGGVANDLASDPSNYSVLYTSIVYADYVSGSNGIYKSTDTGATWTKVSGAGDMDPLLLSGTTSNVEIAVGNNGEVYAGVINSGQLAALYRSPTGNAGTWVAMDTPQTNDGGTSYGIQPNPKGPGPGLIPAPGSGDYSGGQGSIHFSIQADPAYPYGVYVGGDRQPTIPSSIGNTNWTGRLFRGNAAVPPAGTSPSPQWDHLTHVAGAGGMPGGGTASNSAPHADSRDMKFDANENLVEGDDGGVYLRSSPQNNTGDWYSLNGDLAVTELHSVAWDSVSDIIVGGTQDVGSAEQSASGSGVWREVSQGDGGKVAIDDIGATSYRYTSAQKLGGFMRRQVDSSNNVLNTAYPAMTINGSGGFTIDNNDSNVQFYSPIAVNNINHNLYVGTSDIYESTDLGATFSDLSNTPTVFGDLGSAVTAIDAGGMKSGVPNTDMLYVGAGSSLFVRNTTGGTLNSATASGYTGSTITNLIMDTQDYDRLFMSDLDQVFLSADQGASFSEITGDLIVDEIMSMAFISLPTDDAILVGGQEGVFFTTASMGFLTWAELGANTLPNASVWDMEYDAVDDILVAGTLGRGAWAIPNITALLTVPEPGSFVLLAFGIIGMNLSARSKRKRG